MILLLEEHIKDGGQVENADLINRQWRNGDQLLTEQLDNQNRLAPSTVSLLHIHGIAEQHRSWDLPLTEGSPLFEIFEKIKKLKKMAITGLELIFELAQDPNHFNSKKNLAVFEDVFYDYKLFNENSVNFSAPPFFSKTCWKDLFFLIPIFRENLESVQGSIRQSILDSFLLRNTCMVNKIFQNLQKEGFQRVWLISGAMHGQYGFVETKSAVVHLYETLKQANLKYITLKRRKNRGQLSKSELADPPFNHSSDFKWQAEELTNIVVDKSQSNFYRWDLETNNFITSAQWKEWFLDKGQKIMREVQHMMDIDLLGIVLIPLDFITYSLDKIERGHVLELAPQ